MGGFFSGFGEAFGKQFSQAIAQKKALEMQAHTSELNAIGHLLDKPDLTDSAREELTQRYLDVSGKMSPAASGILGRLMGRDPKKKTAPQVQNGTFSEDRLQAPAPEFTDTGAKYRSGLPPVPGATAPPPVLSEYQGVDDFGSAETSPAAAPVTRPPVQTSTPSPGLPPVPTAATGAAGVPGRMFKTEAEKRAGKMADATATAGVQTEAMKTRGANATAERLNLENQLKPIRQQQALDAEQSRIRIIKATADAQAQNRQVPGGVGPKPGGMPWEYVHSMVHPDGSVIHTPASAPVHIQTAYQMAAAKVAQSGEPPSVENLQKAWNEVMTTKSKKAEADAKGAEARAKQTEMRNKGTLPAPNRAPGAAGSQKPPTRKDYDQIEKDYQSSLKTVEAQHNNRRQAVQQNRNISADQKKDQLNRIEAERETAKKAAETAYKARIKSIQGGENAQARTGTGNGKQISRSEFARLAKEHGKTIAEVEASVKSQGYKIVD